MVFNAHSGGLRAVAPAVQFCLKVACRVGMWTHLSLQIKLAGQFAASSSKMFAEDSGAHGAVMDVLLLLHELFLSLLNFATTFGCLIIELTART